MADIRQTTNQLKIGLDTESGKTKYITIENPKSTLTAETVKEAGQYLIDNNVIWSVTSDGEIDSYTKVATAYTENKSVLTLDLG